MKAIHSIYGVFTLLSITAASAQTNEVFVKGTVIDAETKKPIEYATVSLISDNDPNNLTGDLTDVSGKFNIPVITDQYTITVEYMGYKTYTLASQVISNSITLGEIKLTEDSQTLDNIVIEVQRSPVELRLDKKVYNVGDDMIVKGGTASDVLDNVPSIEVDSDGNVSLRGNESVKVLIDGKPSGMASNIADALKMLPAESIDKVEVITNPSARYEAEGGAGIVNIVLKKGANQGLNGSVTANYGIPESYGANASINYKGQDFNLYTNLGYSKNKTFGNSLNETEYFDENGLPLRYVNEYSRSKREREGYNANLGFEWNLTNKLSWNNNITLRRSLGDNPRTLHYDSYDASKSLSYSNVRQTEEADEKNTAEYTTDFTYKFDDKGHQLFLSGSISKSDDLEDSDITTYNAADILSSDVTKAYEDEMRQILRLDYVLPVGEGQFEAGYLGNFNELKTDFNIRTFENGSYVDNPLYQSNLEYLEKVHALYAQYGNKINKFNYMVGLRWEASEIDVNQLRTNDFNNKKYNNFFPSAFLNYEFSSSENASISYSKRVRRPRGRMLNPISSYSSSINFFMGNPDLNPSFTDAIDLGYMKRWNYFTFNASAYFNRTTDATSFVRRVDGVNEEGIPITISGPINLATEYRYGVEFNLTYNPYKWWRMNGNVNIFQQSTRGDYDYVNFEGNTISQNFDNDTFTWTARLNNKITLPYAIDWQTNVTYRGPQTTAQGNIKDELNINLALSKDIIKDKATLSLNVQDLLNSRKRRMETFLPQANSYAEMQWRERTINLAFTYRFNQKKNDPSQQKKSGMQMDDMDEMM